MQRKEDGEKDRSPPSEDERPKSKSPPDKSRSTLTPPTPTHQYHQSEPRFKMATGANGNGRAPSGGGYPKHTTEYDGRVH